MRVLGPKPDEPPPSSEVDYEEEVYAWRKECFLTLGFSSTQAGALARKKEVDHHKVGRVIVQGCPIDLAVKIFL